MIIYLAIGTLIGLVLGIFISQSYARQQAMQASGDKRVPYEEDTKKIMDMLEQNERITNNDIEGLLNVSDATATRYLDRLEERGLITQRGKGRGAYYVQSGK